MTVDDNTVGRQITASYPHPGIGEVTAKQMDDEDLVFDWKCFSACAVYSVETSAERRPT